MPGGGGWFLGHLINGTRADTVAVVGAGPIGPAAITTARLCPPEKIVAADLAPARLDAAKRLGADAIATAGEEAGQLVFDLTEVVLEGPQHHALAVRTP